MNYLSPIVISFTVFLTLITAYPQFIEDDVDLLSILDKYFDKNNTTSVLNRNSSDFFKTQNNKSKDFKDSQKLQSNEEETQYITNNFSTVTNITEEEEQIAKDENVNQFKAIVSTTKANSVLITMQEIKLHRFNETSDELNSTIYFTPAVATNDEKFTRKVGKLLESELQSNDKITKNIINSFMTLNAEVLKLFKSSIADETYLNNFTGKLTIDFAVKQNNANTTLNDDRLEHDTKEPLHNIDTKLKTQRNETKSIATSITELPTMVNENPVTDNDEIQEAATTTIFAENEKPPSDESILTELTKLSSDGNDDLNIGQKIKILRSNPDCEMDGNSTAGTEILEHESGTCGTLLGKRISFANFTTLMEYPWTALLLYNTKDRYHCGGSLITTRYVLTAAHCVAQEFYELSGVRLGEHDVTTEKDCDEDVAGGKICSNTIDVSVVKIIIHHGYSTKSFKNDIALLRLDGEYTSRSFYPICITPPDKMYSSKQATVAGWGATQTTLRSSVLLQAEVPILDMAKCRSIYRYSKFNDSTEICASGVNEVDVCKGDSGGAIFYRETSGRRDKYFQLGIISLGVRRCGDSRFLPAVFIKLQGYYKWIENNLEH